MTTNEINATLQDLNIELDRLTKEQLNLDISDTSVADYDQYDMMLDECHDEVDVCGYKYAPSQALKQLDPTAYRCGFLDYLDGLDIEESDEWKELEEQIEDIRSQIEQLENELEELEETEE